MPYQSSLSRLVRSNQKYRNTNYSISILAGQKMSEINYREMIKVARENKEYLSFIDLEPNTSQKVTIEKLIKKTNVVSVGGRVEKVVYLLKFKGTEKLLWLSLGKLKALGEILGQDTKQWAGKQIALYADSTVRMKGQTVGGLVIKEAK